MNKKTKLIPLALVAAMATSPFLTAVPKAYALTFDDISASDYETDTDADYTFSVEIGNKLKKGDTITIKFPKEFELDESGDEDDVKVDDDTPKSVDVDDDKKEIEITLNKEVSKGEIDIDINDIITNPDESGSYSIKIETENESSKSKTVKIKDGSSSGSKNKNKDKEFDLTVSGKYTEDKTKLTLGEFTLSDKLAEGDYVYVTFPTDDMLPKSIDESDVEINGEEPKSVSVSSGNQVKITVPRKAAGKKDLEIIFKDSAKITLPSKAKSSYYFKVKYDGTTYDSESFEVKSGSGSGSGSSSSDDFTVKLSDASVGARSSYNFSMDLGKEKLSSGGSIEIEFPSSEMVPPIISANAVTINGDKVSSASSYGSKVYLKTASNFKSSSTINVIFDYDAYISNPKMPGSDYVLVARTGSKNIKSQKFSISDSGYNPNPNPNPNPTTPTTPNPTAPVVANNSMATVQLTKSTLKTPTGINIGIKALGLPVAANTDFIEVVIPAAFRVPTILNAAAVKVNGVQPSYVAARGQNLLIYPAQNLPVNAPVSLSIAESAGIATPATKNVYSIGVYTSKEKNLLFARPVSVGGAVIPATQQPGAIPASAARIKLNVASYTMNNKTYPMSVAPYTLNGNTMVPEQFFKQALSLTTRSDNSTVAIISGATVIKFTIGSNKAKVGSTEVTMPVAVQLKNGMPMLPIRMIADNLKYKSGWDAATGSVYIYK